MLTTDSDGGHKYIVIEIIYYGKPRRLTALFKDKLEELKIQEGTTLTLSRRLQDGGIDYGLLLLDNKIIDC